MTSVSSRAGRTTLSPRNMLVSLQSYPRIHPVPVFLAVLVFCFLPSLADIVFWHDLSLVAHPSDVLTDGEERDSSEPLAGSDFLQNDALIHQLVSSLDSFTDSAPIGEDPAAQEVAHGTLYRLSPRPPPSIR